MSFIYRAMTLQMNVYVGILSTGILLVVAITILISSKSKILPPGDDDRTSFSSQFAAVATTTCKPAGSDDNLYDKNDVVFLPYSSPERMEDSRSHFYVEGVIESQLKKIHVNCSQWDRVGTEEDGGWDVCISGPYRPKKSNCLVYSFGIGYDFRFDDKMASSFDCRVRSFDPSMTVESHERSKNVRFYRIGLSGNNTVTEDGWKLYTLSNLMEMFGEQNTTIDYLKLDIEGYEWLALEEMLQSEILRNRVRQVAFEVHFGFGRQSKSQSVHQLNLLVELEKAGFRRWSYRPNSVGVVYKTMDHMYQIAQHEIVYINRRFKSHN